MSNIRIEEKRTPEGYGVNYTVYDGAEYIGTVYLSDSEIAYVSDRSRLAMLIMSKVRNG